jgi:hypothetical protein
MLSPKWMAHSHIPDYLQGWQYTGYCPQPGHMWQWTRPSRQASWGNTSEIRSLAEKSAWRLTSGTGQGVFQILKWTDHFLDTCCMAWMWVVYPNGHTLKGLVPSSNPSITKKRKRKKRPGPQCKHYREVLWTLRRWRLLGDLKSLWRFPLMGLWDPHSTPCFLAQDINTHSHVLPLWCATLTRGPKQWGCSILDLKSRMVS